MNTEPLTLCTEQPTSSQLDKIVDSLSLLINMQMERDEREQSSFAKIESHFASLKETINELELKQSAPAVAEKEETTIESGSPENTSEAYSILEEYGFLNDDEDNAKTSDSINAEEGEDSDILVAPEDKLEVQEDVCDLDVPMSEEDAIEIEELKEALRQKLREAEVELSIKRANLMQRLAKVEEREAQFGQTERLKDLNTSSQSNEDKRLGILSRFKNQLQGFKKQADSDESDN